MAEMPIACEADDGVDRDGLDEEGRSQQCEALEHPGQMSASQGGEEHPEGQQQQQGGGLQQESNQRLGVGREGEEPPEEDEGVGRLQEPQAEMMQLHIGDERQEDAHLVPGPEGKEAAQHSQHDQQEVQELPCLEDENQVDETKQLVFRSLKANEVTYSCNVSENHQKKKDLFLKFHNEDDIERLVGVYCSKDPAYALSLLQKHSARLRVLELYKVRPEHLVAALGMPRLRDLQLQGWDDEGASAEAALPRKLPIVARLQKLEVNCLPWSIVAALLTAHRLTLLELKLCSRRWSTHHGLSLEEARLPETLPRLRTLDLSVYIHHEHVDELEVQAHEKHLSLLAAARLSLEELTLLDVNSTLLLATQGMPRLQELEVESFHGDQGYGAEPPLEHQLSALRKFVASRVAGQVSVQVLAAHRRTLEEVSLRHWVTPEVLVAVQRMPRLRDLSLQGFVADQLPNPAVVEVEGATLHVQTLNTWTLPWDTDTLLSLLSLYTATLLELQLDRLSPAILVALAGLPLLRRLKLHEFDDTFRGDPAPLPETLPSRLEFLRAEFMPRSTLQNLLAASRATLQEVELGGNKIHLEDVQQALCLPTLRSLRLLESCRWDPTQPVPPLPRERLEASAGLRIIQFPDVLPRLMIFSLLTAHSRTLEEVDLVGLSREQLLATLRMPSLRRLRLRGVRRDLCEAARLPEVAAGPGCLEWMRMGEWGDSNPPPPFDTIRCLLTAHRHSLRSLELDVECGREEGVWPVGQRDLHRLLQQCGLERLETLTLNRKWPYYESADDHCSEQLAALQRVLPGTAVRCSDCHYSKDIKDPF